MSHQLQQAHEELGVFPDDVVGLAAEINEALETLRIPASFREKVVHLRGEDERSTVPAFREKCETLCCKTLN